MAVNLELARRIKEVSTPRETREDIVEYYQEKYPDNWKRKLSEDLQGFTTGKKETFQSIPSIQRRFQARGGKEWQSSKPSKKQQEEYAALGDYLPKKPPSAIIVSGTFCVRYLDNPCEERSFILTLSGDEMTILLEQMDMQVIINKYMEIPLDDDEPAIEECPCGTDDCQCDYTIVAIEE